MEAPLSWTELEEKFRRLFELDPTLRADGSYIVGSKTAWRWRLAGTVETSVLTRFRAAAELAGTLLNSDASDPFSAWLEYLRHQSAHFDYGLYGIEKNNDGTEGAHHLSGTIPRVCLASADQCCVLEMNAVKARHGARTGSAWKLDFGLYSFLSRVTEECFAMIADHPEQRTRLLCDAAVKCFDFWASSRVEAVRDQGDLTAFSNDLNLWRWEAIGPLRVANIDSVEQRAIEMLLQGRIQYWIRQAMKIVSGTLAFGAEGAPDDGHPLSESTPGMADEGATPQDSRLGTASAKSTEAPVALESGEGSQKANLIAKRECLLAEYQSEFGGISYRKIYGARNSGIHKPEFYQWKRGLLPENSVTTQNFERFLQEKRRPIPRSRK